jgi:hypothetical protein
MRIRLPGIFQGISCGIFWIGWNKTGILWNKLCHIPKSPLIAL